MRTRKVNRNFRQGARHRGHLARATNRSLCFSKHPDEIKMARFTILGDCRAEYLDPLIYPNRGNVNVDDLIFEDITVKEVEDLNKKICIYKSSGIRTISRRIWKIMYQNFPLIFTNLYNQIMNDGIYPEKWKIATVVPIPKVSLATYRSDLWSYL